MGLLTNLVEMKHQRELDSKRSAIEGFKMLMDPQSGATDQIRQWAGTSLAELLTNDFTGGDKGKGGAGSLFGGGTSGGGRGGKAGVGDFFHKLLTPFMAMNPAKSATPGFKQEMQSIRERRPQGPMFLSQDEREYIQARQTEIETQEKARQAEMIETAKKKADLALETDPKYHDALIQVRKKDMLEANVQEGTPEYNEYVFGIKPVTRPAIKKPGTRKAVEVIGPDGKKFTAYLGQDETGADQLYKLGSNVPLDPSKYAQVEKEASTESGMRLKEEESILRNLHPKWTEQQVKVEASKKEQEYRDAQTAGARQGVQIRAFELPGAGGSVAPPAPSSTQTPYQRLNVGQRALVDRGLNAMVSSTSMGMAGALRYQVLEARRIISEATGVTSEELDSRIERRQASKRAFDRMKLLGSSVESLYGTLDRQIQILTMLRPKLPNTDVTKINEWLQSGAREFNVGGVSEAAVRYGQALAAVRNDYARVIAGGAASVGQTPVEALRLASENIRPGFNTANTNAMVDQMLQEGRQAIGGREQQLANLKSELSQKLVPELYGDSYKEIPVPPPPTPGGGSAAGGGGAIPTVRTKAEYDKLPSGAIYLEDGKRYRKP